jgi:shikimate kinase/3-dehydroquinate synthase
VAIVLIGFMGAGKSTAAGRLAQALGVEALDSDRALEERFGHSVAHEFELHGEQVFREAEAEVVCGLLARADGDAVIALGGGSVLSERVRAALAGHTTVLLEIEPEEAWERVRAEPGGAGRPLAVDLDAFRALHAERGPVYEGLADVSVTSFRAEDAEALVDGMRALGAAPEGTRLLWATSDSGSYPVLIGNGLLGADGGTWPLPRERSRAFCVTDESVGPRYEGRLGELALTVTVRSGEENSKNLATAETVWQELARAGMTRADHLVALGGGVVGDLAGFCAATYQRGVPVVQVPTTLVAQVDSAYGGKTGVDLPQAKNYVGVYHQPAGVMVDPEVLASLPKEELASGWVEVLKTALIAGGRLWEQVASGGEVDVQTIFACVRTKLATVAADERDGGRRQVLNLGHTVGHAIETAAGYGYYRHGEAVGLGLLAALRLSGQPQLHGQVEQLLTDRGLPVKLENADVDAVLEAMRRDKKRIGTEVPFVLVDGPGRVEHGRVVAAGEVRAAVQELIG